MCPCPLPSFPPTSIPHAHPPCAHRGPREHLPSRHWGVWGGDGPHGPWPGQRRGERPSPQLRSWPPRIRVGRRRALPAPCPASHALTCTGAARRGAGPWDGGDRPKWDPIPRTGGDKPGGDPELQTGRVSPKGTVSLGWGGGPVPGWGTVPWGPPWLQAGPQLMALPCGAAPGPPKHSPPAPQNLMDTGKGSNFIPSFALTALVTPKSSHTPLPRGWKGGPRGGPIRVRTPPNFNPLEQGRDTPSPEPPLAEPVHEDSGCRGAQGGAPWRRQVMRYWG